MAGEDLRAISCSAPGVTSFVERSDVSVGSEFEERFLLIVFSIGICSG
jgi:hypothetical protein